MGIFRFILAALVMLSHIPGAYMPTNYGLSAVFGFYCLSGWLMAMSFRSFQGKVAQPARAFYFDRVIKLWPLYALVLGLSLILFWVTAIRQVSISQVIIELFLIPNAFGRPFVWGNFNIVPPAWSLGVEAVFYLIVPFLSWISFRAKVFVIYVLIAAHLMVLSVPFTFGAIMSCSWPLKESFCSHPVSDYLGTEFPLLASVPFLVGFVAHDMFVQGRRAFHLIVWWGMYLIIFTEVNKIYPVASNLGSHEVLFAMVFVVPIALILLATRTGKPASSFDRFLGDLSYPLFLSHYIVIFGLTAYIGAENIVDYAFATIGGDGPGYIAGQEAVKAALAAWSPAQGLPLVLPIFVLQVVPLALLLAYALSLVQVRVFDRYRYRARGFESARPTLNAPLSKA